MCYEQRFAVVTEVIPLAHCFWKPVFKVNCRPQMGRQLVDAQDLLGSGPFSLRGLVSDASSHSAL